MLDVSWAYSHKPETSKKIKRKKSRGIKSEDLGGQKFQFEAGVLLGTPRIIPAELTDVVLHTQKENFVCML